MVALLGLLADLVVVAVRLRVDYFDSYQNLLNARALIDPSTGAFSILRGPLYPILLLPVSVAARLGHSPMLMFLASHLLAVVMLGLLLWCTVLLFRLHLDRLTALAGVVLLSWNVLLIANGPLAKEDIPGTLFLTAAFLFYLKSLLSERRRELVLAGVLIGAAASTRYSLLPVPFVVIAGYELVDLALHRFRFPGARRLLLKGVFLIALPVALIFLVPTVAYIAVHRASVLHAPVQFIQDLLLLRDVANAFHEDAIRMYRFLVEAVTWPVVLAALVGVVASIQRRQRVAVFYALWFLTIFGLQTYAVVHKEARYLLPALPPLYWFAAVGLEAAVRLVRSLRATPALAGVVVAALLALPLGHAVAALARFNDPVYTQDYEGQLSRDALGLAGSRPIVWVGPYYPLHPRDYVFDPQDAYTYIFHFYWHVVSYWLVRPVDVEVTALTVAPVGDGSPALSVFWPSLSGLQDGEAVIVNPAPQPYDTGSLPAALPPLVVERLALDRFAPQAGGDLWTSASGSRIQVVSVASGWRISGEGVPDGRYDLYLAGPDPGDASRTPVTVQGGSFQAAVGGPGSLQQIALVSYQAARSFPHPGSGG